MEWDNPRIKFVVTAIPRLCMIVFLAAGPYAVWLYHHRPHDGPQGLFTARPIFGQVMYLLPWEHTLLSGMVIGSWLIGAITVLMWKSLYGDDGKELISRPLFGVALVVTIVASIVAGDLP